MDPAPSPAPPATPPTLQPTANPAPPAASPSSPLPSALPASPDGRGRRASRKLHKRRPESEYAENMEFPERLKEAAGKADKEEEVLRPGGYGRGVLLNMNQSIFGLIAAAGSQADFAGRFESQSSEDEGDDDGRADDALSKTVAGPKPRRSMLPGAHGLAQTTVFQKKAARSKADAGGHRRKISESRLYRSVSGFAEKLKPPRSSKPTSDESSPQPPGDEAAPASDAIPGIEITRTESRTAPVMSRMLEARAEMEARPSFDGGDRSARQDKGSEAAADAADNGGPTELAKKLADIFRFDQPEEVIEEYPCWLLQHVLLQGYMYITARHIAFYAYLPKKAHEVAKSGYLSKCGKRNPKYNRYWFRLKGDVLSYYRDPKDLYFPHGQIDLRYGISATITDKDKEGVNFAVATSHRTYYFRADSPQSAKEWVKSLQRVIFRSHNDGDSVKISLPIENVIDIEETNMLDFAETCKIRVIDNDETYAIDEYFFSFFSYGKEAINVLKILVEDASSKAPASSEPSSKRTSLSGDRSSQLLAGARVGKINEGVRATLSPMTQTRGSSPGPRVSPRPSADRLRSSFDAPRPLSRHGAEPSAPQAESPRRGFHGRRRSASRPRPEGHERHESSDSYVQSVGDPSQASMSAMVVSASSDEPSASQILRNSDVFHNPSLVRTPKVPDDNEPAEASRPPPAALASLPAPPRNENEAEAGPATPTLQSIASMGGYPFRKANALIGYLGDHSRRMSNLLAAESMGYVEKVSGMWKGGGKHYDGPPELRTDDDDAAPGDGPEDRASSEARFRAHFALPEGEKLQAAYFGHLMRLLPLYGKIYISDRHFCFRSLLPGTRTKLILPLRDIENAHKEKGFRFGYAGLVVVIRGHEELFFEFHRAEVRDDCAITLLQILEASRYLRDASLPDGAESEDAQAAATEHSALQKVRAEEFGGQAVPLPPREPSDAPTIIFDDPKASFLNFKPARSLRITCLTIGSRGDVQPYIALCKKLLDEGHRPRIATHAEFRPWIESHGIEYAYVGGDPAELMHLCIQNGTFTWAFLKEANAKMRGWLDDLLATAWAACQGSDLLIESPSAMAGIHIAEALEIPYFRAFTMPWTRTRTYPHAFVMPSNKLGGAYNYVTYVMFDNVFWKTTAHQINRWRNNTLGLPNTNLEKLQVNKVPFLYNFSPYVVPPPLDYSDWIRVTGYWFLDEGRGWTPPKELTDFIAKARQDGKKLVYVGFGSILVPDPAKMTQDVIDAVLAADVRCILSKGWSDRLPGKHAKDDELQAEAAAAAAAGPGRDKKPEPELPPEIFQIQSAPHDWLFRQVDAAAHHGGSGTTGASLRAGIPTIIRPFFGDQYFFGSRVEDLGVGICLDSWGPVSFGRALWMATTCERLIAKARVLGEQIRKENGVETAVQCLYRDLEYATNLIKAKASRNKNRRAAADDAAARAAPGSSSSTTTTVGGGSSGLRGGDGTGPDGSRDLLDDNDDDEDDESWTFVVGGDGGDVVDEAVLRRTAAATPLPAGLGGKRKAPVGPGEEKGAASGGEQQESATGLGIERGMS
ncbi:hypothetical protein VTJ83DRAFT_2908 [Remersonia thermophila]|uniref:sterol 3beta-glucosyltransferase n=1 Tax=Remersonia thermophila TaxID=72144 RepID=A0ABR4DCP9_9PEZI